MIWLLVTILCGTAIAVRCWTLRGTPPIWWVSFTLTLVCIIPGAGFLYNEEAVNRALGIPNVAYLLSDIAFALAAGSVRVYVQCLRRDNPSPHWLAGHALRIVGLLVAMTALWLADPVRHTWYPRFVASPGTWQARGLGLIFHSYLGFALADVAWAATSLRRRSRHDHDPGRRHGLRLISYGAVCDVVAHLLYVLSVLDPHSPPMETPSLAKMADFLTLLAMLGIAAGTCAFVTIPVWAALSYDRKMVRTLRPLWKRIRHLVPAVGLRSLPVQSHAKAQRMAIEITDGLHALGIVDPGADSYGTVVETIARPNPPLAHGTSSLATLLPELHEGAEGDRVLMRLATLYRSTERELDASSAR